MKYILCNCGEKVELDYSKSARIAGGYNSKDCWRCVCGQDYYLPTKFPIEIKQSAILEA